MPDSFLIIDIPYSIMIAPNPAGDHRKHDTALRHKIRNLRAKVRLLLPLELCCKEQRRSKNLMKMKHNR